MTDSKVVRLEEYWRIVLPGGRFKLVLPTFGPHSI